MREHLYHQLSDVEDQLWWHDARRKLVRLQLRRLKFAADAVALDVGCGTGGSFGLLSEFAAQIVGLDCSPIALQLARVKHPSAILKSGDASELTSEFAPGTFDLVALFNVLYHSWISDDTRVVEQVRSILKPGGVLVVTDAAFLSLFRKHDRLAMGVRRYRLAAMRRLLTDCGLEWHSGTYFNAGAFLPAWLSARWDAWSTREDDRSLGELCVPRPWMNAILKGWMAVERQWIRLLGRMPIGVSLLAVARKPSAQCRRHGTVEPDSG